MKTLLFLYMFCSVAVGFSQDLVGKYWLISELIGAGDGEEDMYELRPMTGGRRVGFYAQT